MYFSAVWQSSQHPEVSRSPSFPSSSHPTALIQAVLATSSVGSRLERPTPPASPPTPDRPGRPVFSVRTFEMVSPPGRRGVPVWD